VKGNMQLFSVDQQRSQALEAHAASFASFKVPFSYPVVTIVFYSCLFISSISNLPTSILSNLSRLLVMRTHQPLFVSPRRQLMLDKSLQSCMLLNWAPSQVCILRKVFKLIFFSFCLVLD
jgi:hypothetical protein